MDVACKGRAPGGVCAGHRARKLLGQVVAGDDMQLREPGSGHGFVAVVSDKRYPSWDASSTNPGVPAARHER